jgi:hypothetical protein
MSHSLTALIGQAALLGLTEVNVPLLFLVCAGAIRFPTDRCFGSIKNPLFGLRVIAVLVAVEASAPVSCQNLRKKALSRVPIS